MSHTSRASRSRCPVGALPPPPLAKLSPTGEELERGPTVAPAVSRKLSTSPALSTLRPKLSHSPLKKRSFRSSSSHRRT